MMDFLYNDSFFFFNDTATTEIYTLSLHDALPIYSDDVKTPPVIVDRLQDCLIWGALLAVPIIDRKSTRLNSSHQIISYAVFCLKKKKHRKPLKESCYHSSLQPPQHVPWQYITSTP